MVLNTSGYIVGLSSTENYLYDDPFELVLQDQIRDERDEFFNR